MPELDSISLGLPVDIGSIDRELKKLWEEGEGATTRASLVNFAVYCHGRKAMAENTELISKLMQSHACRAILIGVEPGTSQPVGDPSLVESEGQPNEPIRIHAWIDAHCHISREGAKQVCCEQISFLLEGDAASLIPNIVFSHLDSDLPLYLWWQGDFTEICQSAPDCKFGPARTSGSLAAARQGTSLGDSKGPLCQVALDRQSNSDCLSGSDLWSWVDRLFFDSLELSDFQRQLCYLRTSILREGDLDRQPGSDRLVLCDLNWGRSLCLRQAIAQIFDSPENVAQLKAINQVSLTYAPGYRSTAALVVGWMISQLGWKLENVCKDTFSFDCLGLELHEKEGAAINECSLFCKDGSFPNFYLRREMGSAYWHADICRPDGCEQHHLFPAGCADTLSLLDEELMLGGKHLVYLKALAAAESLF